MKILENKGVHLMLERLAEEKKGLQTGFLITCAGAVLGAFVPLIYGQVTRVAGDKNSFIWYMWIYVFMWATIDQLHNLTTRYADRKGADVGWTIGYKLFMDGLEHLIHLPMTFLGEQRLGKIVQRIERGADRLEQTIREGLFSLAPHFLSFTFAVGIMFWIKWQLALAVVTIVTLYTTAMISSNKKILELNREIRKMWEEAWGHLWDVITNIKAVKANTNEGFEAKRLRNNFGTCYDKERAAEDLRMKIKAREHLIFGLGAVMVISYGALMLRWGIFDAGNLISFLGYVTMAYTPFSRLAHNWRLVQETIINEERVANFLSEERENYDSGRHFPIVGSIEFRNVSFRYDGQSNILEGINLQIKAGETVAIVGESGVGKTTLTDLICQFYKATGGQILIDGKDIGYWSLNSLRSQIAIVPQDISLFNDKIRLNIAYGKIEHVGNNEMLEEVARAAYADEFIESERFTNGYDQVVGERGIKLSAGQRQRIAIARALMRDPKILILDEATSALDSKSEKYVQEALQALIKSRTTLIIAHRLSTIKKADKIVVIHEGRIAETGKHDELLMLNGAYRKLVELQNFGILN